MNWKETLYHHEVAPPAEVWDRIEETIASDPVELRRRLGELETTPPPAAWQAIQEALNIPDSASPVVPLHKPNWRYWVAAAAMIGVAIGVYMMVFTSGTSVGPQVATSLIPSDSPAGRDNKPAAKTEATTTQAQATPTTTNTTEADPGHPHLFHEYHAPGVEVSYADGNYIQLKASDGHRHRVSYKCVDIIPCLVKGVKDPGQKSCEANLNKWTKQLESSSFIPAPDNFFDIAGMANMLESAK